MPGLIESHSQDSFSTLINTISNNPESFLHPTDALKASTLVVTKRLLDPLASKTNVFDQVYTNDMHIDQIWQQIKLISDVVVDELLEYELPTAVQDAQSEDEQLEEDLEGPSEDLSSEEVSDVASDESASALDQSGEIEMSPAELSEDEEDFESFEHEETDAEEDDVNEEIEEERSVPEPAVKDVFGLNEGFFDIDDFNRQTEAMDANYERDQSEDDVDYNADPDMALDDDLELEEDNDNDNANEIRFDDFFAPPKAKSIGKKRKRARFEDEPEIPQLEDSEEEEEEVIEPEATTMARVQKDLFADDNDDSEEDAGPKTSAYAKRQARLAEEIRQLENENVAKKDWTLMGEASSRARPMDSLLEEGLDFERTRKPVPVVTEETTQTLEQMIKDRIIAGQFDTVVKKIPQSVHKFAKASFELDESKPSQSLAEVYETEFEKKKNPNTYQSAEDKKTEAEHREIESLFKDLCYNLDSLSSWHYTPKPITESLSVVTNAPAIDMEDAQPLTMSSSSRLAPQEQYTTTAIKGEVVGKSGLPQSKAEMTSEERQRHRRRQRERAKNSGAQKRNQVPTSRAKQEQAGVISTLKNANVKVIRDGKTRDLRTGKDYNGSTAPLEPSNLRL